VFPRDGRQLLGDRELLLRYGGRVRGGPGVLGGRMRVRRDVVPERVLHGGDLYLTGNDAGGLRHGWREVHGVRCDEGGWVPFRSVYLRDGSCVRVGASLHRGRLRLQRSVMSQRMLRGSHLRCAYDRVDVRHERRDVHQLRSHGRRLLRGWRMHLRCRPGLRRRSDLLEPYLRLQRHFVPDGLLLDDRLVLAGERAGGVRDQGVVV
jgi:hypothetical protein